jgi:alpha-L-fucosidase 2
MQSKSPRKELSKNLMLFFAVVGTASLLSLGQAAASPVAAKLKAPERGFISSQPAETWQQGLISGNGTIGANVLSRPLDETIIFTHERLFLPKGPPVMPPLLAPRLFEIRRLIDRGLYKQATELAFNLSEQEGFMYPDPFVPAFDLSIQMDTNKNISDYMRSVDFQTGEATVHWADSRGVFERRLFVSRKDGVAVLLMTGPEKGINCRLKLKLREPSPKLDTRKLEASARVFEQNITDVEIDAQETALTFRNSFAQAYPGSIHALEGLARVVVKNGKADPDGETLIITGADQVLLFIDIRLIHDPETSQMEDMKESLAGLSTDYQSLLQGHAQIHGELFNRVKLDIGGGSDHALTSEELLEKTSNEQLSKALIEKEFDAGRYNIISCTGELPPVLQGIWAGTYSPSWASDFTHNGNVPSAIASMLMGNTPELMLAYTNYMESIVPYMELNARRIFGARGIILPSRSTTNGFNNSFAPRFAGAFWVAGAAWAAHFFYDYYLYTGDREFLKKHALPFMEKAAVFFEDYLYEGPDGKYIFSPTQSPENTPGNSNSQGSFNATMDVDAAKELLRNLIAASRELGVNEQKIPQWIAMLDKLPDYLINKDGSIKEWLTPKLEDNHAHRHSSHLYALYDGLPEEIAADPQLRDAFKRVIEIKLERHWKDNASGFMSFGVVQLGQAATSLGESELAYECLKSLVNRYWLHNLASMHNHKTLFNMDISGGMPAVIIKMLMASEPGKIRLLPALPAAWPDGQVTGLLARGGFEVDITWKNGNVTGAMLRSKVGGPCQVIYEGKTVDLDTEAGKTYTLK